MYFRLLLSQLVLEPWNSFFSLVFSNADDFCMAFTWETLLLPELPLAFQCQSCEWFTANTGQEVSPGGSVPARGQQQADQLLFLLQSTLHSHVTSSPIVPFVGYSLWELQLTVDTGSESCPERCKGTVSPSPQLCSCTHNTASNSPSYPEVHVS